MCGSINDSRAMQHLGLHYEYLDQLPSLVLWKTRGLCLGNVSSQSGLLIKYFQILHQEKVHYLQRLKTPQGKHKPHSEILFLQLHGLIHDDD